jgi:hypothetical protein
MLQSRRALRTYKHLTSSLKQPLLLSGCSHVLGHA